MTLTRTSTARIAVVVLGALLLSLVATAAPATAAGTRQFTVLNLSSKNIKLVAIEAMYGTNEPNKELPPVNSVYIPGDEPAFEMDNEGSPNSVRLRFIALDNANKNVGTIAFAIHVNGLSLRNSYAGSGEGTVEGSTNGGQYLRVFDKASPAYDASGWAAADQARVAGGLCRHPDVTCKTVITTYPNAPQKTFADKAQQSVYESNSGCSNLVHTWSIEKSLTVEHSWEMAVAFSKGVKDVWSAELSLKYGGKSIDSTKVTDTITRTLKPGERGWVVWRIPVLRYRGDWTVTTPTVTLTFKNLPVDTGDTDRKAPENDYRSDAISPTGKVTKPSHC
jgi:hypothetical protein